jgi:hypothetical protein
MSAAGVYDPVTKVVTGGRGGNRLGPGHPARARRPYTTVRALPPDPLVRDRMAREHMRRAVIAAVEEGELRVQEAMVLYAGMSFSDDALCPVFASTAAIGRRCGMAARTVRRWLRSLEAKGWTVRAHRFVHFRDRETGEAKMRGTSALRRFDVPPQWWTPLREAADQARSKTKSKGRATPKAPQNQPSPARAGRPDRWRSKEEIEAEQAEIRAAAQRAEARTAAMQQQARADQRATGIPDHVRAALKRAKDEAGPGP